MVRLSITNICAAGQCGQRPEFDTTTEPCAAAGDSYGQCPRPQRRSSLLLVQCKDDPFLKELDHTILSDPQGVQTFGYIKYVRDKVLDLQPNSTKVLELMDHQRNALNLLQRIIACVEKEAEQWRSSMQALAKAVADEEKAQKKALEKEQKDQVRKDAQAAKAAARKAKLQEEKEKKEAERAAAAERAATALAAGEGQQPDEDDKVKNRRRRTGVAATELDPSDPAVLRTLRVAPQLNPTVITEEIKDFVHQICVHPQIPVVLRFKKGMVKKVISVSSPVTYTWVNVFFLLPRNKYQQHRKTHRIPSNWSTPIPCLQFSLRQLQDRHQPWRMQCPKR